MSEQLSLDIPAARTIGAMAGAACADKAERVASTFSLDRARTFALTHLRRHGATSGEDLVDAMLEAGIVPHDLRAFGVVFADLSRFKLIERYGFTLRRRGHGTAGGIVWRITARGLVEAGA